MDVYKKQTLSESFSIYFDKRMLRILLLGIISGFPWVLIGSSLSLWLKEDGLSRSTIGWAGLIFAVYAFNYLWAPLVDRIRIPWLTNKIGHRRGWIVIMQLIILISLISWSVINPTANLALVITIGLIIAIASATQDITVDALRIEQIGKNEGNSMQAGAAMAVVGWWTGYKLGGMIALNAAEFFQNAGFENYWQFTFLILGIVIIACNIGLMFVHEEQPTERQESQKRTDEMIEKKLGSSNTATKSIAWISGAIAGPIISFFKKMVLKLLSVFWDLFFFLKLVKLFWDECQ
jgi:PAT family beta-lactamase induction signal transducer AmpG